MCWLQRYASAPVSDITSFSEFCLSSRRRYEMYVSHSNSSFNPQWEQLVEALIGSPGGVPKLGDT